MQKTKAGLRLTYCLLLLIIVVLSCSKPETASEDLVGNWKRSSEYEGVGRTEAVVFIIGDKAYVGSGYDGTNRRNDFWEFNYTTGTWKSKAPFPGTARNSAVAFSVNGKGYVGTGYDGLTKLKDFWQYDPSTDTWTQVSDFGGTARYGAVAFSIGGKGYVTTGYDGNFLKDLWSYDPATNTWLQLSSLTGSKRTDAVAFVYNDKAYVLTGVNNGSYVNDFWMYDPGTDTWSEKRKISTVTSDDDYDDDYGSNITRSNATVFIIDNNAYLFNGYRSGVINSTWAYDITNDVWYQKTGFEGPAREGAISFNVNNRGFTTTGNNSSERFDDCWEFFPNAEQNDNDN